MKHRFVFLIAIALMPAVGAPVMSSLRFAAAQRTVAIARAEFESAMQGERAIAQLRATQERIGLRLRPTQDVIALTNTVLAEAGLSTRQLASLTPEADAPVAGGSTSESSSMYRRQSIRVTLQGLTVRELGGFLSKWRLTQRIWTPFRIELNHVRGTDASNDHFDAILVLGAIYVSEN